MLVLTRGRNQKIRIGDDIVITIIEVGRDTIKIGISAPPDVKIDRLEVLEELLAEQGIEPTFPKPFAD